MTGPMALAWPQACGSAPAWRTAHGTAQTAAAGLRPAREFVGQRLRRATTQRSRAIRSTRSDEGQADAGPRARDGGAGDSAGGLRSMRRRTARDPPARPCSPGSALRPAMSCRRYSAGSRPSSAARSSSVSASMAFGSRRPSSVKPQGFALGRIKLPEFDPFGCRPGATDGVEVDEHTGPRLRRHPAEARRARRRRARR